MAFMRTIFNNSFVRDVIKLASGTLAGRAIALLALPVITRLYSPEDFALLAVYLALVATLSVAACLRLEIAIPLADDDNDAAHLLALSLIIAVAVSVVALIIALTIPDFVASALGKPRLASH